MEPKERSIDKATQEMFRKARERGTNAVLALHYSRMQTDPEYRKKMSD